MTINSGGGGTVKVVAPATLSEGYTFDAVVDGKTVAVTVPAGGVKEGETFEATLPTGDLGGTLPAGAGLATPLLADQVTKESAPVVGVEGRWRHGLFSCFDVCCNGMFWMAWCFNYAAVGQLLQRLKMNVLGRRTREYNGTCLIWTGICIVVVALDWAGGFTTAAVNASSTTGEYSHYQNMTTLDIVASAIGAVVGIFALVALTNARYWMRTRWSIPADCCDGQGCLGDCCAIFWCGCCSVIQMMRHTHDEEVEQYDCCGVTGLRSGAAEVV